VWDEKEPEQERYILCKRGPSRNAERREYVGLAVMFRWGHDWLRNLAPCLAMFMMFVPELAFAGGIALKFS
jgi:hypothetical protein